MKGVFKSPGFRKARKIAVAIVGSAVVLAGVFLLFFPGPAFVVIPAGLGILATEFRWARKSMGKIMSGLKYLSSPKNIRKIVHENSLSVALLTLFLICLAGQLFAGFRTYNQEQRSHGQPQLSPLEYLTHGHPIEATFENWESEFLQMGTLVILTVFLRQKGAADSQPLGGVKAGPASGKRGAKAPWPMRKGGWVARIYQHSLSISLFSLFLISFGVHAAGGRHLHNAESLRHGEPTLSLWEYLGTSRFWFESLQNWQSEFFSVAVLLVLSIFLRERGSPQSKPVEAPYSDTGRHEPATAASSKAW